MHTTLQSNFLRFHNFSCNIVRYTNTTFAHLHSAAIFHSVPVQPPVTRHIMRSSRSRVRFDIEERRATNDNRQTAHDYTNENVFTADADIILFFT